MVVHLPPLGEGRGSATAGATATATQHRYSQYANLFNAVTGRHAPRRVLPAAGHRASPAVRLPIPGRSRAEAPPASSGAGASMPRCSYESTPPSSNRTSDTSADIDASSGETPRMSSRLSRRRLSAATHASDESAHPPMSSALRMRAYTDTIASLLATADVDDTTAVTKAARARLAREPELMRALVGGHEGAGLLDDDEAQWFVDAGIAAAVEIHVRHTTRAAKRALRKLQAHRPDGDAPSAGCGASAPAADPAARARTLQTIVSAAAHFRVSEVEACLSELRRELCLDEELPILALVLLERCATASAGCCFLAATNWHLALLGALMLAYKSWCDVPTGIDLTRAAEAIARALPERGVPPVEEVQRVESEMAALLNYRLAVSASEFYSYYYSARDLGMRSVTRSDDRVRPADAARSRKITA